MFSHAPSDTDAQQRLVDLYERDKRFGELVALWQKRADAASAAERPGLLLSLAQAQEKASDLPAAASTLLTLFALTQGADALAALERVLGLAGRHLERAEALRKLAALTQEPAQRVGRLVQQARALLVAGEPDRAVTVLAEVLSAAPSDARAVAELVPLLSNPAVRNRAAELLETVFLGAGETRQRLAVLEGMLETPGLARERVLRTELATLHEQLGNVTQAFAVRLRLVNEQPGDAAARAELERLATQAHLEEDLVAAYEDLLDRTHEHAVALALREKVARAYAGPLKRPELAAHVWERIAQGDRKALLPLVELAPLYKAAQDWLRLAGVLNRQVGLLPGAPERVPVLRELAQLAEGPLKDKALAVDSWKKLLEHAPSDRPALQALGRLLEGTSRGSEAAQVLERQLAVEEDPREKAVLELRLGRLALASEGKAAEAFEWFVLALKHRWPDAEAVSELEALLGRAAELKPRIAEVLEPVYREKRDVPRLAEALELQVPAAPLTRQLALLEELAVLRESAGDLARAFTARNEVFSRAPEDPRGRTELERLAEATGQLDALVAIFRRRLAQRPPDAEAVELWRRVAQVSEQLGKPVPAAEAWEQVARLSPVDPAPLVTLGRLYAAQRSFEKLPRLLQRRIELASDVAEQVALCLELARLAEDDLNDAAQAIDALRAALDRGERKVLPDLERMLEKSGRFDELCTLLEWRVQQPEDAAQQLELTARLAGLEHRARGRDERALELLHAVLEREPHHAAAVGVLEHLLQSERPAAAQAAVALEGHYADKPALQVEALEVRASHASPGERLALLHRIADLHELELHEPDEAFLALARLLHQSPDDGAALERVLRLGAGKRELAALLSELAPKAASAQTKLAVLLPLARLRGQLSEPQAALEAWQGVLALEPQHREALEAASALLEAAARWPEQLELLERRLKLATDDEGRAALLDRIGRLRDDSLADAPGAHATFRRLLELRPDDAHALERLDGLCERLGRWEELAEILSRRLKLPGADREALVLRLAQVRRARLNDAQGALPLLAELLSARAPNAGAVAELEALVAAQPSWESAADLLLDVYRRAPDFAKLAVLLDAVASQSSAPARRKALWLELAEVRLKHDDDAELAFLALAKAYRETPDDAPLRSRLIALAEPADQHEALGALLDEVMGVLPPPAAAEVALSLAGLSLGPLGEPERSVELYRQAMELEPSAKPRALAGLDAALERLNRWDELLPVLEAREQAAGEGLDRIGLLLRIGAVCAERLDKLDRAIAAYRAVLLRDKDHLGAARALEALYERAGQTGRQLEILERLVVLVPAGERQATRLKLARLSLPADPERSVALCRDMLADDPLHPEAFALLSEQLESTGRLTELDALLKARLAVTLAPNDAAALELRLGELHWRKLRDAAQAAPRYRAVLERLPKHELALDALSEIYESTAQKRELAAVLGELAQVRSDVRLKRAHQVRRAEVLAELNDGPGAVAAARAALELSPDGEGELERLRAVLLGQAAWAEAARALSGICELRLKAGNTRGAVESLFELHNVEGRRNSDPGQAAALEKILSLEPSNRTAYDFAKALYGGAKQWPAWAALSARFLPHLSGDEHLSTLDALADVHARRLGDPSAAFGFAVEAVRRDSGSAARREAVERLGRTLKRMNQVADVYRAALEPMTFGAAYSAVSLALAAVEDEHLNQVAAAEGTLHRLLERDPTHLSALDALARMYERRGLHEKRAATLELKLHATADAAARAALFEELAVLQETRLKNVQAAADALNRRLDEAPTPEHARPVAELHRRHQQWPRQITALQRLASLHRSAAERAGVQLEIAVLYEQQLRDSEAAIAAYAQVLETEATNAAAFRALEKLYGALQRPNELLRAYAHRVAHTDDVDEKIALHFKSAALHEQRSNPLQADAALEAVVRLRATEVKALEGLERLRRSGGRWRPLVDALSWHVAAVKEPAALAALCTELGEAHLLGLRDPKTAATWWEKALEHLPSHQPALHALGSLHEQQARWGDAVRCYEKEATLEQDPARRAELELRTGVLCEERLRHEAKARAAYGRALAADPVHLSALRRLRALFFKAQQWADYEANLAVEANQAREVQDRAAAALELARHYAERAKDPEGAISWYGYAFDQRPDALEAALPLADLLLASGAFDRAAEVLRAAAALLEQQKPIDAAELNKRLCQLAQAQRQLGQTKAALESYGRALQRDPVEPTALRGQIDLLEAQGHAAQAADKLELFLDHHERTLKSAERSELRVRLGELYWGLGEAAQADRAAEGALAADSAHAPALRLAIKACDRLQAFERAAAFRLRLTAVATGDERYRLFVELGTLCLEKLSSATRAVDALLKAQELRPRAKEVFEKLLAAYKAAGHNRKAAEVQEQLLVHPELTAAERRTHTLALADLVGRAMGDTDQAVELLERALDQTPDFVEALQAIEAMLARGKSWARLDASYQGMIRRLGDTPDTAEPRAALWRALGELRARRIKDKTAALAAYEEGAKLLPDDPAAQEAFAEPLMEVPERAKDALAAWLRALPRTPRPSKACLAAATLAERAKDLDSAYLALRAAQVFTEGPVESKLLETLKAQAQVPPRFRGILSDRGWRDGLLHPALRGPLGELMGLICEAWASKHAPELDDFKLSARKHAIGFSSSTHPSLGHLSHVAQMMGIKSVGLMSPYLAPQSSSRRSPHPDDSVCLKVLPTNPMSIVVGERFVNEREGAALYAQLGFHLVQLRPEVAVTLQLLPDELELVLEAALGLGDAGYVSPKDARLLKGPRKKLEKALSDNARLALQNLVGRYRRVAKPGDLARYLEGARLTPLRAAVLVSGDFAAVKARLMPDAAAARELLRFALSGELHALRVETGTALVAR